MAKERQIPDLTFPEVEFGELEIVWNLNVLLYRGGAKEKSRTAQDAIAGGALGKPRFERVSLVRKLHDEMRGKLVAGARKDSARGEIRNLRDFFKWADENGCQLTLDSVQSDYLQWADSLLHRHRVVKDLKQQSAYVQAARVGGLLDAVLERHTPIIQLTGLEMPVRRKSTLGVKAEKQNLEETFKFGHALQDVCDVLTEAFIFEGDLPVRISLRDGTEIVDWSGANPRWNWSIASGSSYESDRTIRTRHPLINSRIEAELLMFIGQTGMNFSQAQSLKFRHFSYASHLDGYHVRDRKARRGGDVLFEIFKEYKSHFERYLKWRARLFPDSDRIFPFINIRGGAESRLHQFRLRKIFLAQGIPFVPPRTLRNTRVNWLLRRSGDPVQTAEMAQHSKETLALHYEEPSLQRAISEVMRFWVKNDPHFGRFESVSPGECDGKPVPTSDIPQGALRPDCLRPSGCLWCEHHRDIDSQDYIWSLASYRHLKLVELSKWTVSREALKDAPPVQLVIDRLTEKLQWFGSSSDRRRRWLEEALTRIEEGSYHDAWEGIIHDVEGAP